MTRTKPTMSLLAYLLVAMGFTPTNAQPTSTKNPPWDEGARESLIYLVSEGCKVLDDLADRRESTSQTSHGPSKRSEKGAIIGGTVASGIVLGMAIFVGVLAYRQYAIRRQHRPGTAQSRRKDSDLEATIKPLTHGSWRQTFNHRVSIPRTSSVYSGRSFDSTAAQVEVVPPSRVPEKIPSKAASVLGIGDRLCGSHSAPVSPLLPPPSALTRDSQKGHFTPSSRQRGRAYSDRMEHLHDTIKSPSSANFATTPNTKPLPRPPPVAKAPVSTQMPSRQYSVPRVKYKGQLPTPLDENVSVQTVERDESRANSFPLGDNRI